MCRVCVEILSEIFKCKGIRCLCFHDSRKNPTNQIQLILDLCTVSVKVISGSVVREWQMEQRHRTGLTELNWFILLRNRRNISTFKESPVQSKKTRLRISMVLFWSSVTVLIALICHNLLLMTGIRSVSRHCRWSFTAPWEMRISQQLQKPLWMLDLLQEYCNRAGELWGSMGHLCCLIPNLLGSALLSKLTLFQFCRKEKNARCSYFP